MAQLDPRNRVRFPYEVFRDADYAKSGPVIVRAWTEEERLKYMGLKSEAIPESELRGNKSNRVLAKEYGVSERTVRRSRAKLSDADQAELSIKHFDALVKTEPVTYNIEEITEPVVTVEGYLVDRLEQKKAAILDLLEVVKDHPVDDKVKQIIEALLVAS